jgi:hypothetical protein
MQIEQSLLGLSVAQLRRAAELKERIEALNSELLSVLESGNIAASPLKREPRKMSRSARLRIAAAARARWARVRGEKGLGSPNEKKPASGRKPKRTMSEAAKRKIAAAARARWARIKAAKGT